MKCAISHVQNSQECCFREGKSPCGTHSAGQGLVKFNSGETQFQILNMYSKSCYFCYKLGVWGLGGASGVKEIQSFFPSRV